MRANDIVYRGLQPHAAADATVSEKEACGLLVEQDTGAYAELTRSLRGAYAPELTKITWSFSCLTWRFDCSAVVFGLCVCSAIRAWIVYVCVELDCSLVLALLRGVAHVFIMYLFKAYAWLTQKVSLQKAYATLRTCRFCLRTTSI